MIVYFNGSVDKPKSIKLLPNQFICNINKFLYSRRQIAICSLYILSVYANAIMSNLAYQRILLLVSYSFYFIKILYIKYINML